MGRAAWPLLTAVLLSGLGLLISGGAAWALTVVGSVLAFEAFWRLPLRGKWLPLLGQAAFGIYLIHPFFMLVAYKLFGAEVNLLFAAVLTFVMSCAAVLVMRRVPALARLI
ncbi:MAG: Acyltransferase 3, partial [uncultured bacterium]